MSKIGSKELLRRFLLENVGRVLTSKELWEASGGAGQYGRRLRELRDEEGWPIQSHNDNSDLKPGEYLLLNAPEEIKDVAFSRGISARVKAEVLDRNGVTCQMCGLTPGDIDPHTGRKVRLQIGHIVDKSYGGSDEPSNLRALCSTCNQGAKNITAEKPSRMWLLTQVRRATRDDQRAVYEWLEKKFSGG